MGCDGGTIPKRDELVRAKKKPEQKDKDSELAFRWRHCSITQQPLQVPVVACGLGRLYSKVSLIEALLDRSTLPETAQHIKTLKDVKDLNLTPNPAYENSAEKGDSYVDRQNSPYICPVIGLEMSGKFKFCLIWSCGCVMSERALKEVKAQLCHKCQKPFSESDVVILNASGKDLDLMVTQLEARTARLKAEKKAAKKEGKIKQAPVRTDDKDSSKKSDDAGTKLEQKQESKTELGSQKDLAVANKSKPHGKNGIAEKRSATVTSSDIPNPAFKKTKGDYSVAKDPNATDVFKSLFTSHQNAKDQTRAHWVTYNPFYN